MWARKFVTQVRQALTAQLYESVQWTKTMQFIQVKGSNMLQSVHQAMFWQTWQNVYLNIEKAFPLDSKSRLEDALNAILVAEGKIA